MQAPSECERQGAGEGVVHDEVDVKAAEHVAGPHMTCTDHTGRRFAGERPRAADGAESATREREVVDRKVGHMPRHYPALYVYGRAYLRL